ncbi:MAG: group 1 truncated hemoglobin [Gemmatimonadales bacterium]
MRHRFLSRATVITTCFVSSVLLAAHPSLAAGQAQAATPSLYERLGGYDGVTRYIGLVFPRVATHPELQHLFRGHGKDSQQRQFQLVVELICRETGGPCAYIGRPMVPVHDGLGITEANWRTFIAIVGDGIDELGYPADVRRDLLALWQRFRDGVVRP